jgi:DNA polymerase V
MPFPTAPQLAATPPPDPARPAARLPASSPGADSTVKRIDLNDALIRHPDATFVMRAAGAAMQGAGIDDADVLLVDRAIQPSHGHIVVAVVDGELVCRRLWKQAGSTSWKPRSPTTRHPRRHRPGRRDAVGGLGRRDHGDQVADAAVVFGERSDAMFALVDANNMYVSCERVFQPRLCGRPVVVLSSNDGACIARSTKPRTSASRWPSPGSGPPETARPACWRCRPTSSCTATCHQRR